MPRRVLRLLAAVGFGLLVVIIYQQRNKIERQSDEIQDLSRKVEAVRNDDRLAMQEKCAKQSLAEFKRLGWEQKSLAAFGSHYNRTLNKCFMRIESRDGLFISIDVSDAYERKSYGSYMWKGSNDKKYWEVTPFVCQVINGSGSEEF